MRILVTGGAGYVGSRVSAHLLEAGHDVIVLDRLLYGGEGLLAFIGHPRLRFVKADVRDENAVKAALDRVHAVVHLAALVGEEACLVDRAATTAINRDATQSLVGWASAFSVERLIFISTCSNYGISDPDKPADEDAPLSPLSFYAETKVEAERIVLKGAGDLSACVLRFGTICGVSPRMRFNLLVNQFARDASVGRAVTIHGPDAWRPFLHILDAAEAIRQCLEADRERIRGQVFNVVGENCQKRRIAHLVRTHFLGVEVREYATASDRRDYRVLAERITNRIDFRTRRTVEDAFVEVGTAVRSGVFRNPFDPVYEALPDATFLRGTL